MWRSLVACLNGVQEAGSSNLLTQTITVHQFDTICILIGVQFFINHKGDEAGNKKELADVARYAERMASHEFIDGKNSNIKLIIDLFPKWNIRDAD